MTAFAELITINENSTQAVYVQIANGFVHLIRGGIIKPGARLPSVRGLAASLGIHPRTVVAAYEELSAQDWIYSKPRSGMIVSESLPQLKPRNFRQAPVETGEIGKEVAKSTEPDFKYVLNDGFPDYRLSPLSPMLREYKRLFDVGLVERVSMFSDMAGSYKLRAELATYYGESRGFGITPENILITRGAQMAIYLAAAMLVRPGDEVVVGEPNYPMANMAFEQLGAKLIKVPVDGDGIDVDRLDRLCRTRKPRLLYIIPHHHHPTTVTLNAARRMKLLEIVSRYGLHVIEDDYDYEYHYTHRPILPLASADKAGLVWYIGSVTKNLMASIRIGYLIAPPEKIRKAAEHKRVLDLRGDLLLENALAVLFENGTIQRHIRKSVKIYEERRDRFCGLLKDRLGNVVEFKVPDGGMAVWSKFDRKQDLVRVAKAAAASGLGMSDGRFYDTGTERQNALRMGFASMNEREMVAIIGILQKILR